MRHISSFYESNLLFTGCPFRHTDADLLRQRLAAYRVPKKGIDEVNLSILSNLHVFCKTSNHLSDIIYPKHFNIPTGTECVNCNMYCTVTFIAL